MIVNDYLSLKDKGQPQSNMNIGSFANATRSQIQSVFLEYIEEIVSLKSSVKEHHTRFKLWANLGHADE